MIETILFIFRVLIFKQWSGEVEMCIDIQNIGRRYLIVNPQRSGINPVVDYRLPEGKKSISIRLSTQFESNDEYTIDKTSSEYKMIITLLNEIAHNFGYLNPSYLARVGHDLVLNCFSEQVAYDFGSLKLPIINFKL